jgi:hypothetical protein
MRLGHPWLARAGVPGLTAAADLDEVAAAVAGVRDRDAGLHAATTAPHAVARSRRMAARLAGAIAGAAAGVTTATAMPHRGATALAATMRNGVAATGTAMAAGTSAAAHHGVTAMA